MATGDVIDMAGGVMQGHDLGQRLALQQYVMAVGGGNREADDEILATRLADAFDDPPRHAGAVFKAAAPFVRAPVRPGRPELIQKRVIGAPDLHPLKAALPAADSGGDMGRNKLLDLGLRHRVRPVAVVIGRPARRPPMGREAEVGIAMRADMVKLLEKDRARLFHRLCHLAEMRDHLIGGMQEVAARQDASAVDRHRFGHDHPRAPQRAFQKVGAKARAGQAHVGHVRGMGAEDDPVAQRLAAQLDRRHQVGVGGHGRVNFHLRFILLCLSRA